MSLEVPIQMEFGHIETHQQENEPHNITNTEVEQCCRDVVIFIEERLRELPHIAEECNIYRVPKRLLNINRSAYTPQVISIGPFHHGKEDLVAMEHHKLRFLNCYLRRINISVEAAFKIARSWEIEARSCYAEPINMNSDEFVAMMLVDGCFIVEYLLSVYNNFPRTQNGLDTQLYVAITTDIYRDLTMLENQLPFFVLQVLFDLLPPDAKEDLSLIELTQNFLSVGLIKDYELLHDVSTQEVKHLVDFLSFYYVPSPGTEKSGNEECMNQPEPELLPSITVSELCEAGVIVKKAPKGKCFMDITFKYKVLEIPPFEIDDFFENNVRNLMAYEHYKVRNNRNYAIQYFLLLDDLISTQKDVNLLVKAGIITNSIGGSDKEVSNLFINLCKEVIIPDGPYYFSDVYESLREHCRAPWNLWMASLKHNYFNTPWASISFIAATLLMVLTFLETIFSALSFPK